MPLVERAHAESTVSLSSCFYSEVRVKLVERRAPAALMAVARLLVEELFVPEVELGAAGHALEFDRHQRHPLRRGVGPAPAEDQPAIRDDLLVNARAFVVLARRAAEYDAKAPAHAHVELRDGDRVSGARAPPLFQSLRVGPRPPDLFRL